jgi:hypothetical protein
VINYRHRERLIEIIEEKLSREWKEPRAVLKYFEYTLRLSEDDICEAAVTTQNIKKMAKRIALFEELVYGE